MFAFFRRQPLTVFAAILGIWVFLAGVNVLLIVAGFKTGAPVFFPISIFAPALHISGLPYALLFLAFLAWTMRFSDRLNVFQISLAGLILIVLGNLIQGSVDSAFLSPFRATGIQYYHDAVNIDEWKEWLGSFNYIQSSLFDHSRTHPPFAIVIHSMFLKISGNNVLFLSSAFILLSAFSVFLVWHIFKALKIPLEKRNRLTLLFSVIPAVNIYSAVSLDGIILTSSTLFLLGLALLMNDGERISASGAVFFGLGLAITNLLTFGGVFLIAVALIQSIREYMLKKQLIVPFVLFFSLAVFMLVLLALGRYMGYDHMRAFLTASALENPEGFRGWSEPLVYLFTRIECISEIALFFSFGCLAMIAQPSQFKQLCLNWRNPENGLMISGVFTLLAMFITGAFRTGETARCALFIYPYLMLALAGGAPRTLDGLIALAGSQTMAMQLFGEYFW